MRLYFRVHQVEAIYHETGRSIRWRPLEIGGSADVQDIVHKVSKRPLDYKPTETDGGLRLEFDDGMYRWLVYGTPIGRAWEHIRS